MKTKLNETDKLMQKHCIRLWKAFNKESFEPYECSYTDASGGTVTRTYHFATYAIHEGEEKDNLDSYVDGEDCELVVLAIEEYKEEENKWITLQEEVFKNRVRDIYSFNHMTIIWHEFCELTGASSMDKIDSLINEVKKVFKAAYGEFAD